MSIYIRVSLLISLLVTIFYCVVVWYGGNLFAILAGQNVSDNISNFSAWAILPIELPISFNMIHWQLLAAISFLLSIFMTFKPAEQGNEAAFSALPLVNHYGLLLLLTLLHITGFAVSFVDVAYSI